MCRVMGAITETPQMYGEVFMDLVPALDVLLTPEGADHLEDTLIILSYLSFYLKPPFPPKLWFYFECLIKAFCSNYATTPPAAATTAGTAEGASSCGWASDYLEQMLPVFSNFICRDQETFATGRTQTGLAYAECIVQVAHCCVEDEDEVNIFNNLDLFIYLNGVLTGGLR